MKHGDCVALAGGWRRRAATAREGDSLPSFITQIHGGLFTFTLNHENLIVFGVRDTTVSLEIDLSETLYIP